MDVESGCTHDFIYHGALNFFRGRELLTVIDSWSCRRCSRLRLGRRGPGVMFSMEGLYPDLPEGKRWVVFLCLAGPEHLIEVYQMKDGDEVPHHCEAYPPEAVMTLSADSGLRVGADGPPPRRHFAYDFEKIVRGYVDLAKTPPEVVTLTRKTA